MFLNSPTGIGIFLDPTEYRSAIEKKEHFELQAKKNKSKFNPQPLPNKILEPRPLKSHSICCICVEQFFDYFEHIESSNHMR
jgi:hypothetical protein